MRTTASCIGATSEIKTDLVLISVIVLILDHE
jgi:hypothetical protein